MAKLNYSCQDFHTAENPVPIPKHQQMLAKAYGKHSPCFWYTDIRKLYAISKQKYRVRVTLFIIFCYFFLIIIALNLFEKYSFSL